MNVGSQPLAVVQSNGNSAVEQITASLESAGYQVVPSFDLRSAVTAGRSASADLHDCQMVVLLVYAHNGPPVTLVCDCGEIHTKVYLVNNAQQSASLDWVGNLTQLFSNNRDSANPLSPCAESE